MRKTILITGGTGMVGEALVDNLLQSGHTVHVLSTRKELYKDKKAHLHYFHWSPTAGIIDRGAFDNVNVIIHLAGASIAGKRWTTARKQQILESRVDSLLFLYHYIQQNKISIEQLISASAVGWYGNQSTDIVLTEDHPNDTVSFLGQICYKWEQAAQAFKNVGIKVSIVRTGMVLSPDGGAFNAIRKSLLIPVIPLFGKGYQYTPWISLYDLVQMYSWIIEKQMEGIWNAVAGEFLSNRKMMSTLANYKFKYAILMPIPAFILKMAMGKMAEELLLYNMKVGNAKILGSGYVFTYPCFDNTTMEYLQVK